jgi:hypothetical protein
MSLKNVIENWFAHVRSVFKKDAAVVKADLSTWAADVLPKAEKLLEAAGEEVLKAAGAVVLSHVTGGASIGVALDAGLKVLESSAPAEFEAAGKQAAVIALTKALAPHGDAPAAAANAQAQNTAGALNT